jgi:hypothetical protein
VSISVPEITYKVSFPSAMISSNFVKGVIMRDPANMLNGFLVYLLTTRTISDGSEGSTT